MDRVEEILTCGAFGPLSQRNVADLRICVLFCLLIPMKAGVLTIMRKLDSRLRGNDVKVLLQWLKQLKSTALLSQRQGLVPLQRGCGKH